MPSPGYEPGMVHPDDERVNRRADQVLPEERAAGSADPGAQAAALLADSDQRQEGREDAGADVERRTPTEDREAAG